MKKYTAALAFCCALALTSPAGAASIRLASGETMVLGETVEVTPGRDSFFGSPLYEARLTSDFGNKVLLRVMKEDLFPGDRESEKELASMVEKAARRTVVYQLAARADETLYKGLVISIPVPDEDIVRGIELAGISDACRDNRRQEFISYILADEENELEPFELEEMDYRELKGVMWKIDNRLKSEAEAAYMVEKLAAADPELSKESLIRKDKADLSKMMSKLEAKQKEEEERAEGLALLTESGRWTEEELAAMSTGKQDRLISEYKDEMARARAEYLLTNGNLEATGTTGRFATSGDEMLTEALYVPEEKAEGTFATDAKWMTAGKTEKEIDSEAAKAAESATPAAADMTEEAATMDTTETAADDTAKEALTSMKEKVPETVSETVVSDEGMTSGAVIPTGETASEVAAEEGNANPESASAETENTPLFSREEAADFSLDNEAISAEVARQREEKAARQHEADISRLRAQEWDSEVRSEAIKTLLAHPDNRLTPHQLELMETYQLTGMVRGRENRAKADERDAWVEEYRTVTEGHPSLFYEQKEAEEAIVKAGNEAVAGNGDEAVAGLPTDNLGLVEKDYELPEALKENAREAGQWALQRKAEEEPKEPKHKVLTEEEMAKRLAEQEEEDQEKRIKKFADGTEMDIIRPGKVFRSIFENYQRRVYLGDHSGWIPVGSAMYGVAEGGYIADGFFMRLHGEGLITPMPGGHAYTLFIADKKSGDYLSAFIDNAVRNFL